MVKKEAHDSEDEEISFDFSWLKNIFKGKESPKGRQEKKEHEKNDEEEIEFAFNIGGIADFFRKYKVLFFILVPLLLSVFLRVQTASLPITDSWAGQNIESGIKAQIRAQIDSNYQNLPEQNKVSLVESEFSKVLKENKAQLDSQAGQASAYFKS